jgi:hypothetical protein
LESVTVTDQVPAAVGVPVIAPVVMLRVNPAGRVPTIEKVKGAVPPLTLIAGLLNGVPTAPEVPVAGQVTVSCPMLHGQFGVAITPLESVT